MPYQAADMIAAHYLGKWPATAVLRLGLFWTVEIVGIMVFSVPPKHTEIRYGCKVWDFSRLWVHPKMPQNTETFFISKAIKYIKKNHKDVNLIVTYADPSAGHTGAIYRASNFIDDGMMDEGRKTPRCDYVDVDTGKQYNRKGHIPAGAVVERRPRIAKRRFLYWLKQSL